MKACEDFHLFTPGPVSVPPRVLAAGARPMLHHRTPEFSRILLDLVEKAQYLFGTAQDILVVHTSGRGAMEGTILNLFSPGDAVISVTNGKFGEMYAEIAATHGLTVHRVGTDWLADLDPAEIEEACRTYPQAKAITVCHCETTTAALSDIAAVARIAKAHDKLILVDAISSAGCASIDFDALGLDVLVTASQKGLMSPTGLSMIVLSDAAWRAADASAFPKFYIQFRDIQKNLRGKRAETPGSTPVSLVASVAEALAMIQEEGKDNVHARHQAVAAAVRAGLAGMGLALFPAGVTRRSPALTAFTVPAGLTSAQIRSALKADFGIIAAEGLGSAYKDTVVRIGHMGHVYPKDAITVIGALEATLYRLGFVKEPGAGVAACIKALG